MGDIAHSASAPVVREHDGAGQPTDQKPTDLPGRAWWATFVRTLKEYKRDNLSDAAAALTYYSVLALFPAMIVLVALVGLFGQYPETTNALLKIVRQLGPSSAVDTFRKPIEGVVKHKGGAGALLGIGLLAALWSASAYVGAFMRASNRIYEVEEGRPFWKLRPIQVLVTLAMVLGAALVAIAVLVSGPVARSVGDAVGFGTEAVDVWNIAKWPVLAVVIVTMFAVLYYAAPNVRVRFRWLSPGGVVAVVIWLVASALFAVYVANFGSYNATYGSLGGVIIFLVWMWITNIAVLVGLEFNAELERQREVESGDPRAEHELQLSPRDRRRTGKGLFARLRDRFGSRRRRDARAPAATPGSGSRENPLAALPGRGLGIRASGVGLRSR